MTISHFISLLDYKPKHITGACKLDDDVQFVEFRKCNGFLASIEFGRAFHKKENGYYFYFEVLDLNSYKDMDFIPINSDIRHNVILSWPNCDDDYKKLAKQVNNALKKMYKQA